MANRPAMRLSCAAKHLAVFLAICLSLPVCNARASQTPCAAPSPRHNPPTTKKIAASRMLDADALQKFIVNANNNAELASEGVSISDAVIRGRFSLAGVEIKFPLFLNNCEFQDEVDLSWTYFERSLSLQDSTFDKSADLDHVHLEGDLVIEGARFKDSVDISGANVGGLLDGNGAKFEAKGSEQDPAKGLVQFDSTQAAQGAQFLGAVFADKVTFEHLKSPFLELGQPTNEWGCDALPVTLAISELNLAHASIHGELGLGYLEIGKLHAEDLVVEGTTAIANTKFTEEMDLRQSHFSSLMLQKVDWPAKAEGRQLSGIVFEYIAPAPWDSDHVKDADWQKLLDMVKGSAYNPGAYQSLEAALQREGHTELANTVFREMNERALHSSDLNSVSWLKNVTLLGLMGYGREPQYAFVWWIPVIVVGWLIFLRRSDVEPRKPEDKERPYDAFWYSVDLFLPLTRLDAADVWMPRQGCRWRRYYARIHAMLGWILVPIALAAVTGLIAK